MWVTYYRYYFNCLNFTFTYDIYVFTFLVKVHKTQPGQYDDNDIVRQNYFNLFGLPKSIQFFTALRNNFLQSEVH